MDQATVANVAPATEVEAPQEVSAPETLVPPSPEVAPPSTEAPKDGVKGEAVPEVKPQEPALKEEELPFHKRPEFQRLSRQNRKLSDRVEEQGRQVSEMLELLKQVTALQKGEDYVPSKPASQPMDYDSLIDREMEVLSSAENLSPAEESAIIEIAKEYAIESGSEKIPLPLQNALKIYRKLQSTAPASAPAPAPTSKVEVPPPPPTPAPVQQPTPQEDSSQKKPLYRPTHRDPMQNMWQLIAEAKAEIASRK